MIIIVFNFFNKFNIINIKNILNLKKIYTCTIRSKKSYEEEEEYVRPLLL